MPLARGETVVRDNAVAVATVDAELKRPDDIGVIGYADSVTALTQPDVSSPAPDTTTSGAAGTGSAGTATATGSAGSGTPTNPAPSASTAAGQLPGVADTLAAVLNNQGQYVCRRQLLCRWVPPTWSEAPRMRGLPTCRAR